jgi:hypothetical protein
MRAISTVVLVGALAAGAAAQEKPVPKDSMRISVPGCSKGTAFVVMESPEHESRSSVAPGRRFRLAGKKEMLKEIRQAEGQMVEITGLIRKGQLDQGVSIGGVRVSPGPMSNSGSVGSNPGYEQIILDVEGFRLLAGDCPR